jgi:hypothetical protein
MNYEERRVAVQALGSLTILQLILIPVSYFAGKWLLEASGLSPSVGLRWMAFLTGLAGVAIPLTLVHLFLAFCRFMLLLSGWAFGVSGAILFVGITDSMWGILGAGVATGAMTMVVRDIRNNDVDLL